MVGISRDGNISSGDLFGQVVQICEQAGRAIEQVRLDGFSTEFKDKAGQDPVTAADHAADHILSRELTNILPGSFYFSEESTQDGQAGNQFCWIVDPLDGTREFVRGIPEYAVAVLLQEDGQNRLAVIHNPAVNITIAGTSEGITLGGQPIRVTGTSKLNGAKALASRTEMKAGEWDNFNDLDLVVTGSVAWKCALVAAGKADLTFTLRPRHVWDVGAGFALVRWAGGCISDKQGEDIAIAPTHAKVRCFLASNNHLHTTLLERLKDVPLGPDRRG